MKKCLLYTLLVTTVLTSCKRNDRTYRSIDPFYKTMLDWQPGSYWIMQDSLTGQVDSFYVTSYESGIFYGSEDRSNETLDISINEVNISNTSDTVPWYISIGQLGNTNNVQFGYYLYNNRDSSAAFLSYFDMMMLNDITLIRNRLTYQHIYYNNSLFYASHLKAYLGIAVNQESGLVYISSEYGNYNHIWDLLRKKIISK